MDMELVTHKALDAAGAMSILISRATHEKCYHDHNGKVVCKKEGFFHRVGRWIMTGILLFFGLILLLIICCCIKRRRSKKAKASAV